MVSKDDLAKLAEMARIELTPEELAEMEGDFESIVEYVSHVQEVVGGDEEKVAGDLRNVMREDGEPHESGQYTDDLVAQFPHKEGNYLKTKKIIQND